MQMPGENIPESAHDSVDKETSWKSLSEIIEEVGSCPPPDLNEPEPLWAARRARRRQRLVGGMAVASFGLSAMVGTYNMDVAHAKEQVADARPAFTEVFKPYNLDNSNTMVVGMSGVGVDDSRDMMNWMPYLREVGRVVSYKSDPKGIDPTQDAEALNEFIEDINEKEPGTARDIEKIIFVGHSQGGLSALDLGITYRNNYENGAKVEKFALMSTPSGFDTVREKMRDKASTLCRLASYVPGHRYSRILRFAIEFGSRNKEYFNMYTHGIDAVNAVKVGRQVYDEKIVNPRSSNAMYEDKTCVVLGEGTGKKISQLDSSVDMYYIAPREGWTDHIVDVDGARKDVEQQAKDNGMDFKNGYLPPIGHNSPGNNMKDYEKVLRETLIADVQRERAEEAARIAEENAKKLLEEAKKREEEFKKELEKLEESKKISESQKLEEPEVPSPSATPN